MLLHLGLQLNADLKPGLHAAIGAYYSTRHRVELRRKKVWTQDIYIPSLTGKPEQQRFTARLAY